MNHQKQLDELSILFHTTTDESWQLCFLANIVVVPRRRQGLGFPFNKSIPILDHIASSLLK